MAKGTELAKAYVQLIPSAEGIKGKMQGLLEEPSREAGESAGSVAGAGLVGNLKKIIATAGIGALIKETLDVGGAVQQSFGGLDTLYGEASEAAKAYAKEAVSAGISMNNYAEQAVSFGASLKQAVGGDVALAAEAANTAILDMADNAAKMGTPLESIQNAYQGFAKQNYTMLDNLKIGYGGTKQEMERLLKDAKELSGVEYDIDNLADVYSAIHVIQEDLGLTGVAAYEAGETFSGSFGAMKASAENLMANLALGENITPSLNDLVQTSSAFLFNNFLPMIGNIVTGIPSVIGTVLTTCLPELANSGLTIISGVSEGLTESLPMIAEDAVETVETILNNIDTQLPQIISAGSELLSNLTSGLVSAIPILTSAVPGIVGSLASTIIKNLPTIVISGISILSELGVGIISAIPDLVSTIPKVIDAIFETFKNTDWLEIGENIIDGLIAGLNNMREAVVQAIKNIAKNIVGGIKDFLGIKSPSRVFKNEIGKMVDIGLADGLIENVDYVDVAMNDVKKTLTVDFDNLNYGSVKAANTSNALDYLIALIEELINKDDDPDNPYTIVIDGREFGRLVRQYG